MTALYSAYLIKSSYNHHTSSWLLALFKIKSEKA